MRNLEAVTVNWKCGKCDVMHREDFKIVNQVADRVDVLDLVMMIVMVEDGDPHLSIYSVCDGVTTDETVSVLLAATIRATLL